MPSTPLDPAQATALQRFSSQSFFILTGLETGSEFGVDGKVWQVNKFSGIKFLPPGLHFFIFSSAPSSVSSHPSSTPGFTTTDTSSNPTSGIGIRHGLLRFFHPDRAPETIVQEWDPQHEQLKSTPLTGNSKRRSRTPLDSSSYAPATIVSDEYLKGLDAELAPYSDTIGQGWKGLVDFITEETIAKVVGVDEQGCAKVDATTASNIDDRESEAAGPSAAGGGGKQQWGKKREETNEEKMRAKEMEEDEERLMFVEFDLKRSWPEGAKGEELSRWSRDKSWALTNAVEKQREGDFKSLLGELQLSFILFTLLHNFSSLPFYTSLITLVCQSASLYSPSHPNSTSALPMMASFLSVLHAQFLSLDDDFFSTHLPSLQKSLTKSLSILQTNLSDVSPLWTREPRPSGFVVWRQVVNRWDLLTASLMERFGWEFGAIRGGKIGGQGVVEESVGRVPRGMENATVWEDDEEEEDGEDAPVVVELDEYDMV